MCGMEDGSQESANVLGHSPLESRNWGFIFLFVVISLV